MAWSGWGVFILFYVFSRLKWLLQFEPEPPDSANSHRLDPEVSLLSAAVRFCLLSNRGRIGSLSEHRREGIKWDLRLSFLKRLRGRGERHGLLTGISCFSSLAGSDQNYLTMFCFVFYPCCKIFRLNAVLESVRCTLILLGTSRSH